MPRKRAPKTFEEWREQCAQHAEKVFGGVLGNIWDELDTYELEEEAVPAYDAGTAPADFINEAFAEDLAHQAYDSEQAKQAKEESC